MRRFARTILASGLAVGVGSLSCGRTSASKGGATTNDITGTLAGLRFEEAGSVERSENQLVALGQSNVMALREVLGEKQSQLRRVDQSNDRPLGEALQLRQEIGALDDAVIRLTWKVHPQELIAQFFIKTAAPEPAPPLLQPRPFRIVDDAVTRLFPDHLFYPAIVRQYPMAPVVAPPFKPQALLVIGRDASVGYLTDPGELEKLFRAQLKKAEPGTWPNTDDGRKDIVRAWLRLSQEFSQDGFFEFTIPPDELKATKGNQASKTTGRALVVPKSGDHGEITVTLSFHPDGTLEQVSETRNVRAGIRPKCQATKLLDTDSIVRAMAEQDIVVMGKSAEAYLVEQHLRATPALKARLEKLWRRILTEE